MLMFSIVTSRLFLYAPGSNLTQEKIISNSLKANIFISSHHVFNRIFYHVPYMNACWQYKDSSVVVCFLAFIQTNLLNYFQMIQSNVSR